MYINICKIIVDLSKKQLQKEQTHHLYYRAKQKLQSKKAFSLSQFREIINKVNNMGMGTKNCQSRIFYKSTHFPCLRQGIIV